MPTMNRPHRYAHVLTIAGSDSSGGAGIQADLKVFAALGCYGMSAITALTAQNTIGVQSIHAVPAEFLKAQIQSVVEDIGVDAVKIGMLPSPSSVEVVAWAIDHYKLTNVVLDPVMVATSGDRLMADATVQILVRELFPRVSVITPNLDEAALLLGRDIPSADDFSIAAQDLLSTGSQAVLLKGGHLLGGNVVDVLLQPREHPKRFESTRIASHNLHGTGCTLSSAIAAFLALGNVLPDAVRLAHAYILQAIAQGADVTTGHGHGPLNHGFDPVPLIKLDDKPRHPS